MVHPDRCVSESFILTELLFNIIKLRYPKYVERLSKASCEWSVYFMGSTSDGFFLKFLIQFQLLEWYIFSVYRQLWQKWEHCEWSEFFAHMFLSKTWKKHTDAKKTFPLVQVSSCKFYRGFSPWILWNMFKCVKNRAVNIIMNTCYNNMNKWYFGWSLGVYTTMGTGYYGIWLGDASEQMMKT